MNEQKTKWAIRPANKDDIPFIYATWLNSYYHDSWARSVKKTIYFDNYKHVIDQLLQDSEVKVACLPENTNVILGFLVEQLNIVHYCFVKEAFRRMGVAKSLFDHEKAYITHITRSFSPILRDHEETFTYNPFILFNQGDYQWLKEKL